MIRLPSFLAIFCVFFPQSSIAHAEELSSAIPSYIQVNEDKSVDVFPCYPEDITKSCTDNDSLVPPQTFLNWSGDLNDDGVTDYILVNQSGRHGYDIDMWSVYIGKAGNFVVNAGEFMATHLIPTTRRGKNGFLILSASSECIYEERHMRKDYESDVVYNPEARQYQTEMLKKFNIKEYKSLCSIAEAPSFDCDAITSQTEKLICSNRNLSELDSRLAYNYRQAKDLEGIDVDLLVDQRAWLKLRNACKTIECLTKAYIKRINAICNHYPNTSGRTCLLSTDD
jgi:uncharacterized protein YecT (DUF1311 family)